MGEFISGSGSTLMAVVDKNADQFVSSMKNFLNQLEDTWKVILLDPDLQGARVLS